MRSKNIYKLLILMVFILTTMNAKEGYLDIDAEHFESSEEKNYIFFKGNVKMVKNKDILLCKELYINTVTKKGKQIPKNYKATGDVSFTIHTKDNTLKGKGDVVFYYPEKLQYIIEGNGYLEDTKDDKRLNAHKIYIDEKTGKTKIDGQKNKPVKFRLKIGEEK
ncbi:MAG: LptA/OstA family protein [Campylobacterota bacterium]|nr:LptA/OstA family protein [Campylobacterota bacterium]